jgi:hypothetical protein
MPAFNCGGPGQSMWDLWWTKWHWDKFFPEYFGFPLPISFQWCSITRKRTKNNHPHHHHRFAHEALWLQCAHSVCCGAFLHIKKSLLQESVSVITLSYLDQCKVYLAPSVSMQEWFQKQLTVAEISQFLTLTVTLSLFFPPGTASQVHGCTNTGHLALPELNTNIIHRRLLPF